MGVLNVTGENYEKEVLKADKPVLIDFYADWCGPCKMIAPILEEMEDASIYKINVDEEQDLAMQYGIMSIPCLISFKDGKEYKRSVGLVEKETISELLK